MCRQIIASLLLLTPLLSLPASADSRPGGAQAPAQTRPWPMLCERFKERYPNKDGHEVFSDKPPRNPTPAWWLLRWEGIDVPVPAVTYEHLFVIGRVEGVVELMLVGEQARVVLFRSMLDEPSDDLFAAIDLSNPADVQTTPEGRAFSRQIFGRPVSAAELMMAAYGYRLEDITCTVDNQPRESLAVYGFPLVDSVLTKQINKVYRNVGPWTGWLSRGMVDEEGRFHIWRAMTLGNDSQKGLHVEIHVRDEPRFANIGLEIAQPDAGQTDQPPPDWLSSLERALAQDTNDGWRTLGGSLAGSGLSVKSIRSIERFACGGQEDRTENCQPQE